jgi:peptidoglycan/LPS O-acetylase OafA/YrhL
VLLSGVGLCWASLQLPPGEPWVATFYRRRLVRIYPLYLTVHLLFLGAAWLVPAAAVSSQPMPAGHVLLSLLGLRVTVPLFFYLSPSFWFVWLILQLYAVYPLLFLLLRRAGPARFFAVCLAITLAARLFGILHVKDVYYWMTGLFFGCRLAEFAAGMALAALLFARPLPSLPSPGRVLVGAAPLYLAGLGCSLTWPGSLVSNLLVTLGLTGLLYALWEGALRGPALLGRAVTWIGVESFAVYLVHHPPLLWTRALDGHAGPGAGRLRLAAAVLVLVLAVPAAALLSRLVNEAVRRGRRWQKAVSARAAARIELLR